MRSSTFIELKNLTVHSDTIMAVGNSHVTANNITDECWVVQLWLYNCPQPIVLYYASEEECIEDYNKVISTLKGE